MKESHDTCQIEELKLVELVLDLQQELRLVQMDQLSLAV